MKDIPIAGDDKRYVGFPPIKLDNRVGISKEVNISTDKSLVGIPNTAIPFYKIAIEKFRALLK